MMSGEQIRAMSRDAAELAALDGLTPFFVEKEDLEDWRALLKMGKLPHLPFPSLGDHVPAGWKPVEDADGDPVSLFVDSSGMGSEGESALTIRALIMEKLEPEYGYAITSIGQFQIYLGKFRKVGARIGAV